MLFANNQRQIDPRTVTVLQKVDYFPIQAHSDGFLLVLKPQQFSSY